MPDRIGELAAMEGYTPQEADFQFGVRATPWFGEFAQQHGEPNLNDPNYDYRAAWTAGARPNVRDPGDNQYHWPSQFKGPEHPNRFVNGVDTITGQPVSTGEEYAGLGGDPSHLANTIKDWWTRQQSWSDRAQAENQKTTEAFQRGGMGEIAKQLATDTTEAQDLYGAFGVGNINGVRPPLAPGALAAISEYRPPFYSAVEQAVQGAKQNAAPGQQWAGFLRNQPGVKPEEVEALGLGKLFEQPGSVPKEAVLGEIAANRVNVGEVIKSEQTQRPAAQRVNSIDDRLHDIQSEFDRLHQFGNAAASERRAALAAQERELRTERAGIVANWQDQASGRTKFQQYTLPGGENYREMLLTLPPSQQASARHARMTALEEKLRNAGDYDIPEVKSMRQEYKQLADEIRGDKTFQSSHYDEPNILAHVRFNDRYISDAPKPYGGRPLGDNLIRGELAPYLPLDVVQSGVGRLMHHNEVQRAVVSAIPTEVMDVLKRLNISPEKLLSDKSMQANLAGASSGDRRNILFGISTALGKTEALLRTKVARSLSAGRSEELLPALKTSDLSPDEVRGLLSTIKDTEAALGAENSILRRSGENLSSTDRTFLANSFSHASLGTDGGAGLVVPKPAPADLADFLKQHEAILSESTRPKKTLFVEEVQSDWHQKGKREGYRGQIDSSQWTADKVDDLWKVKDARGQERFTLLGREVNSPSEAIAEATRQINASPHGVPDAPFKTTWPELAMKRIIREAAEKGYDKVAWTPGSVQAARYPEQLRQHVDEIAWSSPGTPRSNPEGLRYVHAKPRAGGMDLVFTVNKDGVITDASAAQAKGQHVEDIFGKDMSRQIMEKADGEIASKDFVIGAKGQQGFYDEILPATVNRLVKKHGGRVQQGAFDRPPEMSTVGQVMPQEGGGWKIQWDDGTFSGGYGNQNNAEVAMRMRSERIARQNTAPQQSVHTLDITPSLRAAAMKGFPLFTAGGVAATGAIGELARQDEYR